MLHILRRHYVALNSLANTPWLALHRPHILHGWIYMLRNVLFSIFLVLMVPFAANAEQPVAPDAAPAAMEDVVKFSADNIVGHAHPWQLDFQAAASPVMEQFTWLHNYVLVIITGITIFVMALLAYIILRFNRKANPIPATFTHNVKVEVIWTVIPILILVAIVIPSIRIHYNYSDNETIINNPDLTLKVTGHQWYWSYEYPDQGIAFDSNIKQEKDLLPGEPRLLAVDNPIVVPVNKVVRVQVTSADVIHAFAMPAFGVKQDTVPGRLNETWFKATKEGIYYGQCSELCGKYHGFMPIQIHVVSEATFDAWVKQAKEKFANSTMLQFAQNN
jgi:cytochrome c oxidase subunit II